jgi:aminopeptidase N
MAYDSLYPAYTIVHRNLSRMEDVTSSQTYQKGSWTLHMLRGMLGEDVFQRGIRTYYARHFNGNATTADFRRAMEEGSGRELGWFFEQWLYRPGQLRISGSWTYDAGAKQVRLSLEQLQGDENLMRMPIEVGIYLNGQASPTMERVQLDAKSQLFTINVASAPDDVRLDPNSWVLMKATLVRKP